MQISHDFFNLIEKDALNSAYDTVNKIKIIKSAGFQNELINVDYTSIEQVVNIYELIAVNLWSHAFTTDKEYLEQKNTFHKTCKECFNLMHVLPIPKDPIEKIKHVLKLLTYSYLGEKWEDMKRFLKENPDVWAVQRDDENWDLRLFVTIYLAILHLTRKENWEDLSKAMDLIVRLRGEQEDYEKKYLQNIELQYQKGSVFELASLYHLAKSVDLLGQYMLKGTPNDVVTPLDHHFEEAIGYSQGAKILELDIILRMLQATFRKMVYNSVWTVSKTINSRVTKFVKSITESNHRPIFELLYPQRVAILEKGLLDAATKAIVVNLPTSSGKTIIAEFKILQALNQFADSGGKIIYVVPTRALVNQTTSRLRQDLGQKPLEIKIEKMSGAIEIDAFEEHIIDSPNGFDVLVTTPEKLNLLIRNPNNSFAKSLVLVIVDEAHNLGNKGRGLNLEMLISTIKKDCDRANILFLTPFIPNAQEIAKWLEPQNPRSITMELDWWQPNDKVVGAYYVEGNGRHLKTFFKPLMTYSDTLVLKDDIQIEENKESPFTFSKTSTSLSLLTSLVATQFHKTSNMLILGYTIEDTWNITKQIYEMLPTQENHDENIELVSRFVASELGENFPLVNYLKKGIGVHNAGLPDEIRELQEWLMESNSLKIMVATTTLAQGMNFPVSTVLLASYSHPRAGPMPAREFWNIVGRAGRIDQRSLGVIGVAVGKNNSEKMAKLVEYVMKNTEDLISTLVGMIDQATIMGNQFDLATYSNEPEWSTFRQYISHMYKQSADLQNFIAEVDITLRRTYGYNQLKPQKKQALLSAVKVYAEELDKKPKNLTTLSDMTGFSPETIQNTIDKVSQLNIKQSDWNSSKLFSNESNALSKLAGIMLNNIPEIKRDLSEIVGSGPSLTNKKLSNIITDWVSGLDLTEIAAKHFDGTSEESITKCVRAIYSKVTNSATWGLAAIQKMPSSNTNFDQLSDEERMKLNNLPAMIYYGVKTDDAILMRINNIPRSISKKMGELYKSEKPDFYKSTSTEVLNWLKNLNETQWSQAVPTNKKITGSDYKKIWQKLSGMNL